MIDFERWFLKDIEGDADCFDITAQAAVDWAIRQGDIHVPGDYGGYEWVPCLDQLLALPLSRMHFREFFSRSAYLHLAPVLERLHHRHFVGEFQIAANRDAHRDARHLHTKRFHQA